MNLNELLKKFEEITSINFEKIFIPIDNNTKKPLYTSVKEMILKRYQREYLIEDDIIYLKDKNEKIMRVPNIKQKIKYNTRPIEINQDYKNHYEKSKSIKPNNNNNYPDMEIDYENNIINENNNNENVNINSTLVLDNDYSMKNLENTVDFSKKLVRLIEEVDNDENYEIANLNKFPDHN
jgi:hypothetical protein